MHSHGLPVAMPHKQKSCELGLRPGKNLPNGKYSAGLFDIHFVKHTLAKMNMALDKEMLITRTDKPLTQTCISQVNNTPSILLPKAQLHTIKCARQFLTNVYIPYQGWQILFVVFLVHYWCWQFLQNFHYTLENNFIVSKGYSCIELNAHTLITHILALLESNCEQYLLWLLRSVTWRNFHAARSMSSTFSTVIY